MEQRKIKLLSICNYRRMFGGSPQTAGFLDIQWADIVFILVLRGSIRWVVIVIIIVGHHRSILAYSSCVVANNLVRMDVGDILRYNQSDNKSGKV